MNDLIEFTFAVTRKSTGNFVQDFVLVNKTERAARGRLTKVLNQLYCNAADYEVVLVKTA